MKILELENEPLGKLRSVAKALNVPNFNRLKKEALILQIRQSEAQKEGVELRGAEAVESSFPGFFEVLEQVAPGSVHYPPAA